MSTWTGEIEPATVQQIREGRDGRMHLIESDAGSLVMRMRELDPNLRLRYSEAGDYYVVYYRKDDEPEGTGELVATYKECDDRIVKDLERIAWENRQPGYSYAEELEKRDKEAEKKFNHKQREAIGEKGERLAHALRKDLGKTGHKIFVPSDVKE